jgi:menaquinone-dependent protoporphyrinogen oxidase
VSKVLVAYASKNGSTAEIAEAIAQTLRQAGSGVDCVEAGEVTSLEPYDAGRARQRRLHQALARDRQALPP